MCTVMCTVMCSYVFRIGCALVLTKSRNSRSICEPNGNPILAAWSNDQRMPTTDCGPLAPETLSSWVRDVERKPNGSMEKKNEGHQDEKVF